MIKSIFLLILAGLSFTVQAQNLFPVKLDECSTDRFCLDCGDVKASYDKAKFAELEEKLNKSLKVAGIKGNVKFQVIIDSTGRGCVLSHGDPSNHPITQKIIKQLNAFKGWVPAVTANKREARTSINLIFSVQEQVIFSRKVYQISGRIERVSELPNIDINRIDREKFDFVSLEDPPVYPGGMPELYKFLGANFVMPQNIKYTPGKVIVSFVVEKDGSIGEATILQSVHPLIDNEALRVVNALPKWKPGVQDGRKVRVRMNLPINVQ
jgi:TonB family protein